MLRGELELARLFDEIDYAALKGRQDEDYRNLMKEIGALRLRLHLALWFGGCWLLGLTIGLCVVVGR